MTGRPSWRSTATPCAFIATSIAPFVAPKTKSAAISESGLGARIGSRKATKSASVATRVTRALPKRAAVGPVSGIATSAPSAIEKSATPSVEWLIPRRSSTNGMCAAQVPVMMPFARKMTATAKRARRTAERSAIFFPDGVQGGATSGGALPGFQSGINRLPCGVSRLHSLARRYARRCRRAPRSRHFVNFAPGEGRFRKEISRPHPVKLQALGGLENSSAFEVLTILVNRKVRLFLLLHRRQAF